MKRKFGWISSYENQHQNFTNQLLTLEVGNAYEGKEIRASKSYDLHIHSTSHKKGDKFSYMHKNTANTYKHEHMQQSFSNF
jgi:hypothetical protein